MLRLSLYSLSCIGIVLTGVADGSENSRTTELDSTGCNVVVSVVEGMVFREVVVRGGRNSNGGSDSRLSLEDSPASKTPNNFQLLCHDFLWGLFFSRAILPRGTRLLSGSKV